jgi:hypothetical protein
VLLRLIYLGVTNAFALFRLLPMSDQDKDAEILVLRHQITVLQRLAGCRVVRGHAGQAGGDGDDLPSQGRATRRPDNRPFKCP